VNKVYIRQELQRFLLEDLGSLEIDVGASPHYAKAKIIAESGGVFCGGGLVAEVFNCLTPRDIRSCRVLSLEKEGFQFQAGATLVRFDVNDQVLVNGVRTVLNLLAHLTDIATHTRSKVEELEGLDCRLLDTRKTTPGLRTFEKYAVRVGGGYNHRFGRFDAAIVKKEDIAISGGIKAAIDRAFEDKMHLAEVEVEVETLDQVNEVLKDGRLKHLMLDNMDIKTMQEVVKRCGQTHILEASGVGDQDLRELAATGIRHISLGSLIRCPRQTKIKMQIAR
jgi:nicotinate-nucleotide pyrophosphorylase (carboxylating)